MFSVDHEEATYTYGPAQAVRCSTYSTYSTYTVTFFTLLALDIDESFLGFTVLSHSSTLPLTVDV